MIITVIEEDDGIPFIKTGNLVRDEVYIYLVTGSKPNLSYFIGKKLCDLDGNPYFDGNKGITKTNIVPFTGTITLRNKS